MNTRIEFITTLRRNEYCDRKNLTLLKIIYPNIGRNYDKIGKMIRLLLEIDFPD